MWYVRNRADGRAYIPSAAPPCVTVRAGSLIFALLVHVLYALLVLFVMYRAEKYLEERVHGFHRVEPKDMR